MATGATGAGAWAIAERGTRGLRPVSRPGAAVSDPAGSPPRNRRRRRETSGGCSRGAGPISSSRPRAAAPGPAEQHFQHPLKRLLRELEHTSCSSHRTYRASTRALRRSRRTPDTSHRTTASPAGPVELVVPFPTGLDVRPDSAARVKRHSYAAGQLDNHKKLPLARGPMIGQGAKASVS